MAVRSVTGTITVFALETGKPVWQAEVPHVQQVAIAGTYVLAHFIGTSTDASGAMLVELATGRRVFERRAPAGHGYEHALFNGTNLYLVLSSWSAGTQHLSPEYVETWALNGHQIKTVDYLADETFAKQGKTVMVENNGFSRVVRGG